MERQSGADMQAFHRNQPELTSRWEIVASEKTTSQGTPVPGSFYIFFLTMKIYKPRITTKQRLYYIRLIEKLFKDEHVRNDYYKMIPIYRNEADQEIRRLLACTKRRGRDKKEEAFLFFNRYSHVQCSTNHRLQAGEKENPG
jgi:hypothetical protein